MPRILALIGGLPSEQTAVEVSDRAEIGRGDEVRDLADRYDVPLKVMRWIVSDYWDRRT